MLSLIRPIHVFSSAGKVKLISRAVQINREVRIAKRSARLPPVGSIVRLQYLLRGETADSLFVATVEAKSAPKATPAKKAPKGHAKRDAPKPARKGSKTRSIAAPLESVSMPEYGCSPRLPGSRRMQLGTNRALGGPRDSAASVYLRRNPSEVCPCRHSVRIRRSWPKLVDKILQDPVLLRDHAPPV